MESSGENYRASTGFEPLRFNRFVVTNRPNQKTETSEIQRRETVKSLLRLLLLASFCLANRAFCQDANPAIYSEIIPTSSGLAYNSATDSMDTFQAPNGKTVKVLVKGPQGSGTYSRAIRKGETADEYFPAVVAEAQK